MTEWTAFYADATALIGLSRIGRLDLLDLLPIPIRVPQAVWIEVTGDPDKPGADALFQVRDDGLLVVVDEGDERAFPTLDPGESAVLSAAAAVRAAVLLDERKARAFATFDPYLRVAIAETTGIIGLLLLAKRRGRIAEVRPVVENLMRERFRIGPRLLENTLREAGEL